METDDGQLTIRQAMLQQEIVLINAPQRYRCGHCGNRTRFDVIETMTIRSVIHLELSGRLTVEEQTPIVMHTPFIKCRKCAESSRIEVAQAPPPTS